MRALMLMVGLIAVLAAPAGANDDVAAAQRAIRAQVEAISHDDGTAAYSYAAPGIQGLFPDPATFMTMVRNGYAPIYRHKSFDLGEVLEQDGAIAQQAHIVDTDGVPWDALYTLERQPDGNMKITGCILIKTGQGA
jgi:hypothetical protein